MEKEVSFISVTDHSSGDMIWTRLSSYFHIAKMEYEELQ